MDTITPRIRIWIIHRTRVQHDIADAEPHPQAAKVVKDIDANTITNKQVCQFLNLKNVGYNFMDILVDDVLQSYFRDTLLRRNYTWQTDGKMFSSMMWRSFCCKWLLWAHDNIVHMLKQWAWFIIAAYEGQTVDWGYLSVVEIREQFHNVPKGKLMKPLIA